MTRTVQWMIVAFVLATPALIVACAHTAEECADIGTCPPDAGPDAGPDADGDPQ